MIARGEIPDARPFSAGLACLDLLFPRPRVRLGLEQPIRHLSPPRATLRPVKFTSGPCIRQEARGATGPTGTKEEARRAVGPTGTIENKMKPKPDHAHWRGGSATDRLFIITVAIKGIDG